MRIPSATTSTIYSPSGVRAGARTTQGRGEGDERAYLAKEILGLFWWSRTMAIPSMGSSSHKFPHSSRFQHSPDLTIRNMWTLVFLHLPSRVPGRATT